MGSVMVFGAGGPAGANFCRAARDAGHWILGADADPWHLRMAENFCDQTIDTPLAWHEDGFLEWVNETVLSYRIDILHSQPEQGVQWLADHRDRLLARTFLPSSQTIALTQDKFETSWRWSAAHLRPSPVVRLDDVDDIERAESEFGYPMWVRATRGAGARGATRADSSDTILTWIGYWRSRGVDWDFIAEQYLPGRDFAWTSIWREGVLIACQSRERLEYIYPHLAPSGRTGTPVHAVTTADERVKEIGLQAVDRIDPEAHGVFCVDLREDADGGVWPTEINAGRFFTTSNFYGAAGHNFVGIYLAGAQDYWPKEPIIEPIKPGNHWLRHIDMGSTLVKEDE